jgi:hypothetical protein
VNTEPCSGEQGTSAVECLSVSTLDPEAAVWNKQGTSAVECLSVSTLDPEAAVWNKQGTSAVEFRRVSTLDPEAAVASFLISFSWMVLG